APSPPPVQHDQPPAPTPGPSPRLPIYIMGAMAMILAISLFIALLDSPTPQVSPADTSMPAKSIQNLSELLVLDSLFTCSGKIDRTHGSLKASMRYKVILAPDGTVRHAGVVVTNLHSGTLEAWQAFEKCAEAEVHSRTFYPPGGTEDYEFVVSFGTVE
ncbi:MAG: hypothetical protein ACNA8W_16865, partial [Bradymonadaceae bacterium]